MASRRGTRLQSIAEEKEIQGLLKRRKVWSEAIRKVNDSCQDNAYLNWTKGELNERIARVEEASACLDKIHMKIMCDFDEDKPVDLTVEDDEMDNAGHAIKSKIE